MLHPDIQSINYKPQDYLEVVLNREIDVISHVYYLSNPKLLTCFIHLSSPNFLYFDTQSFVSLQHYVKHNSLKQSVLKQWLLSLLEQIELDNEGVYILETQYVFVKEEDLTLHFCKIPLNTNTNNESYLPHFILELYEYMNFEGEDEWVSQLYFLVKQKNFRMNLLKQFLTTKKNKRWFSFFRKEEDEIAQFFQMLQVQESQPTYGHPTTPFETQVLMAGYQYGYLMTELNETILITSTPWIIGRQKDCNYVCPFPEVSKVHLAIILENGSCYVEDRNSTNGTYLNGERLLSGKKEKLKDGDIIKIVGHVFKYHE